MGLSFNWFCSFPPFQNIILPRKTKASAASEQSTRIALMEKRDDVKNGRWPSLFVLTSVYVVGELSHFLLGIVTRPMSQEIGYGTKGCLNNRNITGDQNFDAIDCYNANSSESCDILSTISNTSQPACVWDYSGLGLQYQILAGPAFIAVFTICGIITGMAADRVSRRLVVSLCLSVLTVATTLTGAATAYWHLVVLRMGIGAGESAFAPACSSMISDMFSPAQRGLAMGIFNWGIYFGYGLSYAIGNFVTQADIAGMGWRWSYYVSGSIGVVVSILFLVMVKEPNRRSESTENSEKSKDIGEYGSCVLKSYEKISSDSSVTTPSGDKNWDSQQVVRGNRHSFWEELINGKSGLKQMFKTMLTAPMIMLTLAACVRHTAGFTWAYNTQLYFSTYYPSYNLGIWITAVSIIGGTLGVACGGFVSDRLVKKLGLTARIYVLAASQFIATPFAVGVLYFSPPAAFYILLGSYLFAEMWFGVLFAVLLELIPPHIQSTSIAIFLFVINNVGGNAPVLLEPLRNSLSYHIALLIMYPGFYLISSVLFLVTSFLVRNGTKAV